MGKNGPHTEEKVYDKEFQTNLLVSIQERINLGAKGFNDMTLICNQLKIYAVHIMRNQRENRGKQVRYSSGGVGYFSIYTRVFTKKEIREGLNNEDEMKKLLVDITILKQSYLD